MHLHTDVLTASDLCAILRETGLSARCVDGWRNLYRASVTA